MDLISFPRSLGIKPSTFSPRAAALAGLCCLGCGTAGLAAFDPAGSSLYPQCWFHRLTGLECPGCGATRALYALLHGHFFTACRDNIVFVSVLPLLLWALSRPLGEMVGQNRWPRLSRPKESSLIQSASILLMVLFSFAIVRNLPGLAFAWLRPT